MLISDLLSEIEYNEDLEIKNEKPFRYLALTASDIEYPVCVFLDSSKHINGIKQNVRMIITTRELAPYLQDYNFGLCIVDDPRMFFFKLHNYISGEVSRETAAIATTIGKNCVISKLASIEENNVTIGNNVVIEEFAVIRGETIIGDNAIIRAGVIIGGQGFEYKKANGIILSVAHAGGVIIGNNVEIQYHSCVDKGVYEWDNTTIGDYCKIDNLVHIAHGVKIGKNTLVVANSGIGGRTIIGENVWVGFGATVSNGLIISDNVRINIGAVVTKSIPMGASVSGNFAIDHSVFLKNLKQSTNSLE